MRTRYEIDTGANARRLMLSTALVLILGTVAALITSTGDPIMQACAALWVFLLLFEPLQ